MGVIIQFHSPPARRRPARLIGISLGFAILLAASAGLYFAGKDLLRGTMETSTAPARQQPQDGGRTRGDAAVLLPSSDIRKVPMAETAANLVPREYE